MNYRALSLVSLLILVSSILSLIAAELFVRSFYENTVAFSEHDRLFCYDDFYGWEFCEETVARVVSRDYDHFVRTDASGHRDFGDIDLNKSNIVVLGDSFTSNIGIENTAEIFTEVLERKLESHNVVNLGVNGYGTTQAYLKLRRAGVEYDPDIVILMFYIGNDFYDNVGLLDWIRGYERPFFVRTGGELALANVPVPRKPVPPSQSIRETVLRHSQLAALAREALLQTGLGQWIRRRIRGEDRETFDQRRSFAVGPPELLLASENDSLDEAYDLTCDILAMIDSELSRDEIEFYVFVVPTVFQVRDDYFREIESLGLSRADRFKPNEFLAECGEREEVVVIDLSAGLVAAENVHERPHLYYPQEHHWTVAGNELVAELMYESLQAISVAIRESDGSRRGAGE